MELHQTEQFKDWYGKPVRTQPSGTTIQKDFAQLCWIISFSGRIMDVKKSFAAWKENYLKFRATSVVAEHDEIVFNMLFDKYNMKSAEDLGLAELGLKRMAQFVTDHSDHGNYDREFSNTWATEGKNAS